MATEKQIIAGFEQHVLPGIQAKFPGRKDVLEHAWDAWIRKCVESGQVSRRDAAWITPPDCCL
jgi:hypothetical protein